jgi:hypothetical protein
MDGSWVIAVGDCGNLVLTRSGCGGGFVPQSLTDSLELTDSTMVRNAKNGYKGNFFIQFSFSFHRFMVPMRVSCLQHAGFAPWLPAEVSS